MASLGGRGLSSTLTESPYPSTQSYRKNMTSYGVTSMISFPLGPIGVEIRRKKKWFDVAKT